MFQIKSVDKIKTLFCVQFFFKSWLSWDDVEKYGGAVETAETIWRMRTASWIPKAKNTHSGYFEASWNMMAHAQKPDFVFRRNGRDHLNRRGASVQSTTGSRGVRISGSNAGYTMFRGSVKSTGYPLHSPVSPSLPHPCVTVCHHISAGV